MKIKNLLLIFTLAIFIKSFAQAPQAINYQGVARNAAGKPYPNQNVALQISIHANTATGNIIYKEAHAATTNTIGLYALQIGRGTSTVGTFSAIAWGTSSFYMEVEMDINGGANYVSAGTTELISVPYALYAQTAGSSIPGPQGPVGAQGPIGLTGATGAQGIQGLTGATGPQGPIGSTGATGSVGATGATGPQGTQGVAGTNGTNGTNGQNTLVNTTAEPTGTNCANGGTKVEYGLDANNNGTLEVGEVNASLTKYVCNGNPTPSGIGFSGVLYFLTPSTNTFTIPAGISKIWVKAMGAGGGGGGGNLSGGCGGGGGAGCYAEGFINVTQGQAYSITVGAGGAGGATNISGSAGGTSSFGTQLIAPGGSGGIKGTSFGGAGGLGGVGVGSATFIDGPNGSGGGAGSCTNPAVGGKVIWRFMSTASIISGVLNSFGDAGSGATGSGSGTSGQKGFVIIYY